jgi:hypothetical protein
MADDKTQRRAHKATYARDNKKGGYLIRVEGPHASKFAGKDVPVTRMDNSESIEKLTRMIWAGTDKETGKPVALYGFEPKPQVEEEIIF